MTVRQVSATKLRSLYKKEQLDKRLADGTLFEMMISENRPSRASNQPQGTVSQLVGYYDANTKVAEVHRFLMPDGTLGGSGKPDPKMVLSNGVRYVLEGRY